MSPTCPSLVAMYSALSTARRMDCTSPSVKSELLGHSTLNSRISSITWWNLSFAQRSEVAAPRRVAALVPSAFRLPVPSTSA
eukprot:6703221-Prymnesium_polylepis.1